MAGGSRLFWARVAYHRVARHVDQRLHPRRWATQRGDSARFPVVAAERSSPLQRAPTGAIASFTEEKTGNLRLAAAKLNRLVIEPGEVFSFCRTVGRTTARQGYRPALELHDGQMLPSVGGGLCQLSNLLLLLALEVNAEILERHRHSLDLFRDVERTVPFGCGATVFYNYVDFQFRNALAARLLLEVEVAPPLLMGRVRAEQPLPCDVHIAETDHRFFREGGAVYRANRIWREVAWDDGRAPQRELMFENCCRVMYPADDLVRGEQEGES
jgi:vancomycin resistance protein VanW